MEMTHSEASRDFRSANILANWKPNPKESKQKQQENREAV